VLLSNNISESSGANFPVATRACPAPAMSRESIRANHKWRPASPPNQPINRKAAELQPRGLQCRSISARQPLWWSSPPDELGMAQLDGAGSGWLSTGAAISGSGAGAGAAGGAFGALFLGADLFAAFLADFFAAFFGADFFAAFFADFFAAFLADFFADFLAAFFADFFFAATTFFFLAFLPLLFFALAILILLVAADQCHQA
jgi:hypothetical protein